MLINFYNKPTQLESKFNLKSIRPPSGRDQPFADEVLTRACNMLYEHDLAQRVEPPEGEQPSTVTRGPVLHQERKDGPAGPSAEQVLVSDVSADRHPQGLGNETTPPTQRDIEDPERSKDSSGNASERREAPASGLMAEETLEDQGPEVLRLLVLEARKLHNHEIGIRKLQLSKVTSLSRNQSVQLAEPPLVKQQGGFYSSCTWDSAGPIFKQSEAADSRTHCWQAEECINEHTNHGPDCIGVFPLTDQQPIPRVLFITQTEGNLLFITLLSEL